MTPNNPTAVDETVKMIERLRSAIVELERDTADSASETAGVTEVRAWAASRKQCDEAIETIAAALRSLGEVVGRLPKCWRLDEAGKLHEDSPVVPWSTVVHGYQEVRDTDGFGNDSDYVEAVIKGQCDEGIFLQGVNRFAGMEFYWSDGPWANSREALDAALKKRADDWDAAYGAEHKDDCDDCGGLGEDGIGDEKAPCAACKGTGKKVVAAAAGEGEVAPSDA